MCYNGINYWIHCLCIIFVNHLELYVYSVINTYYNYLIFMRTKRINGYIFKQFIAFQTHWITLVYIFLTNNLKVENLGKINNFSIRYSICQEMLPVY